MGQLEDGETRVEAPAGLVWAPLFKRPGIPAVLAAASIIAITIAALMFVVGKYYERSSSLTVSTSVSAKGSSSEDRSAPGPSESPTALTAASEVASTTVVTSGVSTPQLDFALVIGVVGLGILMLGVAVSSGEFVRVASPEEARFTLGLRGGANRAIVSPDEGEALSKILEGLIKAARLLTPGRLLVVVGGLVLLSAVFVGAAADPILAPGNPPVSGSVATDSTNPSGSAAPTVVSPGAVTGSPSPTPSATG